MTLLIIVCLLLTALCCRAGTQFLLQRKQEAHRRAFLYKSIAGSCFVLIGVLLAICRAQGWWLAAGLFCGLLGDQLLAMRKIYPQRHDLYFCTGAVAFSVGHIFYIVGISRFFTKPMWVALPAFGVLLILSFLLTRRADTGRMQLSSLLYVGIVALVCAAALCALIQSPGISTGMLLIGSISFFVSDNLLILQTFGGKQTRGINIWLHITYYLAQLLIGWSILF